MRGGGGEAASQPTHVTRTSPLQGPHLVKQGALSDWSLIKGRGGEVSKWEGGGGGQVKFYPYEMGGGGAKKVLAMMNGGGGRGAT